MSIMAVQYFRQMRGGSASQLLLAEDRAAYVVKFLNNPQFDKVLFNEWLAASLATRLGLNVPQVAVVEVSKEFLAENPMMRMGLREDCYPIAPGLCFGSRLVGGLMPGHTVDYLSSPMLLRVVNRSEFLGALVFDKWTCNTDGRQAVFVHKRSDRPYTAFFIDHGFCFNADEWAFKDAPQRGTFSNRAVYHQVSGMNSFEKWLNKLQNIKGQDIWDGIMSMPKTWYAGHESGLSEFALALERRALRVPELIDRFRESQMEAFPSWGPTAQMPTRRQRAS